MTTSREKSRQVRRQVDCGLLETYLMSSLSRHVPHVKLYIDIHVGSL